MCMMTQGARDSFALGTFHCYVAKRYHIPENLVELSVCMRKDCRKKNHCTPQISETIFSPFSFKLARNRCHAEIQSHAPCAVSHRQRPASAIIWVLISVWSCHRGGAQTHSTSVYVDLLRRYHFIQHLLPQALLISQVVSPLKIT